MKKKQSKQVTIRVTKSNIANGKIADSDSCPVALAIHARLRRDAYVSSKKVEVMGRPQMTLCLPQSAKRFIDRFDNQKPVKPFSFKLKIPAL